MTEQHWYNYEAKYTTWTVGQDDMATQAETGVTLGEDMQQAAKGAEYNIRQRLGIRADDPGRRISFDYVKIEAIS